LTIHTKRLARALVAGALLWCAALNARAVTALIELRLLSLPLPEPPAPSRPPTTTPSAAGRDARAEVILRRNAFDSSTGPLLGGALPAASASRPVHPLAAPICDDLVVLSTAVASDPRWSSAVIKTKDDPHGKLRRVGDRVAGREIRYIGRNPSRGSPAVWVVADDQLCQAFVFGKPAPPPPKKKAKRASAPARDRSARGSRDRRRR